MPEPAFLVEGEMEQGIVQLLCPGRKVRRIGCNGDKVEMKAIAKFVDFHLRMLCNRYHPIVIVFDRERRPSSCDELKRQLSLELDSRGHTGKYIIGIADRTTENWILADWNSVCLKYPDYKPLVNPSEGKHGKSEIRKLLPKSVLFNERTLGPELFSCTSALRIYENSVSFRLFVDSLRLKCKWLKAVDERFAR